MSFANREDAGRRLGERVAALELERPVVLALPRGGLPVALPVARRLGAPVDLLMVRKLGMPGHEELAAGAVVDGDRPQVVFNEAVLRSAGLRESDFEEAIDQKLKEIEARRARYLGGRAAVPVRGCSAIVIDDGIATGATVKAAIKGLKIRGPARIVLAVPVAPSDTLAELRPMVDDLVCLETPEPFYAVGLHYGDFAQVSDSEVAAMMAKAARFGQGEPEN